MHSHTPDQLNRLYNNRLLVPECMDILARWTQDSATARQSHLCHVDVAYGRSPSHNLDIFPATANAHTENNLAPVVVFIHGGYWRSLDKTDQSFLAPVLTKQGACVVIPNYSLCPAVTVSDIVLELVQAVAWVYKNIAKYGGDPKRITIAGHSAGGHLVAMLLTCLWKKVDESLPTDVVKNALSISGLFEMQSIKRCPYLQDSLHLSDSEVKRISPAWLPAPKTRQLVSVCGGDESSEFLRHNQLIQTAWGKQTVPISEAFPGLNHFTILETLSQRGSRLNDLLQLCCIASATSFTKSGPL